MAAIIDLGTAMPPKSRRTVHSKLPSPGGSGARTNALAPQPTATNVDSVTRHPRRVAPTKSTGGQRKDSADSEELSYEETTDVHDVTHAVAEDVHPLLRLGWKVNNGFPMCFVFDVVLPCRRFDGSKPFNEDEALPEFGVDSHINTVYADSEGDGLMPYEAQDFKYVHIALLERTQLSHVITSEEDTTSSVGYLQKSSCHGTRTVRERLRSGRRSLSGANGRRYSTTCSFQLPTTKYSCK